MIFFSRKMDSKIWQEISSPTVSALINLEWDLTMGISDMSLDDEDNDAFVFSRFQIRNHWP